MRYEVRAYSAPETSEKLFGIWDTLLDGWWHGLGLHTLQDAVELAAEFNEADEVIRNSI